MPVMFDIGHPSLPVTRKLQLFRVNSCNFKFDSIESTTTTIDGESDTNLKVDRDRHDHDRKFDFNLNLVGVAAARSGVIWVIVTVAQAQPDSPG
jgi:hypothetical protein